LATSDISRVALAEAIKRPHQTPLRITAGNH